MVNRANGTRTNDHRANGHKADVIAPLGHKISKDKVEMIPDYVCKVTNWPVPTNGKEVATFLGFHSSVFSVN